MSQNVFFLAVARLSSEMRGVIIGNFSYNTETDLNGVKKVLEQPNLDMRPGKHYSFNVNDMAWHLIQGIYAFCKIFTHRFYF